MIAALIKEGAFSAGLPIEEGRKRPPAYWEGLTLPHAVGFCQGTGFGFVFFWSGQPCQRRTTTTQNASIPHFIPLSSVPPFDLQPTYRILQEA